MSAYAVTGYVKLPDHPRSEQEYHKLLAQLKDAVPDITVIEDELEACWMHRFLRTRVKPVTHSVADNPTKNTVAYHCIQAQKSAWIWKVAHWICCDRDVVVWIDAGIFHLPGITELAVLKFLHRATGEHAVTIPGCWGQDYVYDDSKPCWRFCGGVMIVPVRKAGDFNSRMRSNYQEWLTETGNLSWEVNTLARMEKRGYPIKHYFADHDVSMFANYGAG